MTEADIEEPPSRPRWKQWLIDTFDLNSQSEHDLLDDFQRANSNNIVPSDTANMLQGVLEFGKLQVRDIMLPRPQIDFVYHDEDFDTIIQRIADTEHSRYPVVDEDKDDLKGILLAKDLLRYGGDATDFDIDDVIRPATLVPESQRLDRLLALFRHNRSHMAVVIDEYAGVSGLVTFEDVLEQIIGDIDDEHDDDEDEVLIREQGPDRYIIHATTSIDECNTALGTQFRQDDIDTIAGYVVQQFGRIPRQGEKLDLHPWEITVLRSDNRRVLLLEAQKLAS